MSGNPAGASIDAAQELAPALLARSAELSAAWPARLAGGDPGAGAVSPHDADALVEALVAALGLDLTPLIELGGLDGADGPVEETVDRLDTTLRRLEALREVASDLLGPARVAELDAAVATVGRQLAVQATATLAGRTLAAEDRARAGSDSLAMTIHEVRRPLTVLSSYAQLLESGILGELDEKPAAAVRAMLEASEVMVRQVEALAEVSRLDDPEQLPVLVDVAVEEVVAAARAQVLVEAGVRAVQVETRVDTDLRLRADRARLTLALTNLLSNAVKHSPDGGTVHVDASLTSGAVHLLVRDHGPGFSAEVADRLFEKYYRDPAERGRGIPGTGLGLYLVRAVAERHGGTALARPAAGGGAEFELVLPRR